MEYDDFTGADESAFFRLIPDITRPTLRNNLWFCPIGDDQIVNFHCIGKFDIKNKIIYFGRTQAGAEKSIIKSLPVYTEYMEMALFCWEQTHANSLDEASFD